MNVNGISDAVIMMMFKAFALFFYVTLQVIVTWYAAQTKPDDDVRYLPFFLFLPLIGLIIVVVRLW